VVETCDTEARRTLSTYSETHTGDVDGTHSHSMVLVVECCRLTAVCAAVRREPKPPALQLHSYLHVHMSESESADLASVCMVSAVVSSHGLRQGIKLHRDDVDNGKCA